MKLYISLSRESRLNVLHKMAATIKAADPGHATPGTYTETSCYGKVAHYLRTYRQTFWDPNLHIMLFGLDGEVTHTVLHNVSSGRTIVDTFRVRRGAVMYQRNAHRYYYIFPNQGDPDTTYNQLELIADVGLTEFKTLYMKE